MLRLLPVIVPLSAVISVALILVGTPASSQGLNPNEIKIEYPPTIRTVEFVGNTVIPSSELRQAVGIKSGQLLNENVLRTAVNNIRQAYVTKGYLVAITDIQFPQPGEVGTLRFVLQEVRIAEVRITGLVKTREDVIRGLLTVKAGDLLNREAIQRDAEHLQALGIFSSVKPEITFRTPGEAVLTWQFQEKEKPNYIRAGGSLGQPEGLVMDVTVTLMNIGGRADSLDVNVAYGTQNTLFGGGLRYYNPLIAPKRTSLTASVYSNFRYRFGTDVVSGPAVPGIGNYYERHTGVQTAVTRPERRDLTLSAGVRAEKVETFDLPPTLLTNADNSLNNTVVLGNAAGTLDHRDSIVYPTQGTYTTASLEGGWASLQGDGSGLMAKLVAFRRWYQPLRKPPTPPPGEVSPKPIPIMAYRAGAGTTVGRVPFTEQLFIGGIGDYTLRGYREDRFWGRYLFFAGAEYRHPLPIIKGLVGVAFVDLGDAWNSRYQFIPSSGYTTNFEQSTGFSLKAGAGVGLRYRSAIGPIALDFAYGEEFRIHFNFGFTY